MALICFSNQGDAAEFKGLNLVPSARHFSENRIVLQGDYSDPYAHFRAGYQVSRPLFVGLRQSFEVSSLRDDADRVYPGVDLKLRLLEETRTLPEISFGFQSLVGHKRMAGEYLVASKRFYDFDVSGGVGWGRFGSAGHFKNPFATISSHFGGDRSQFDENPNGPEDWFTGEDVGLFAGVAYDTPVEGLRLTAEYGADRYVEEVARIDGYERASPYSLGIDYSYDDWMNVGVSIQGMDRVSLRWTVFPQFGRSEVKRREDFPFYQVRTDSFAPKKAEIDAQMRGVDLFNVRTRFDDDHQPVALEGGLVLRGDVVTPTQIMDSAAMMSKYAGLNVETLTIHPFSPDGVKGRPVSMSRRDIEKFYGERRISGSEIYNNISYNNAVSLDKKGIDCSSYCLARAKGEVVTRLENQLSLSEKENGFVYRSSVVSGWRGTLSEHLVGAFSARLNLFHNLDDSLRFQSSRGLILRDREDDLADNRLRLDRAYMQWFSNLGDDIYASAMGGYLSERYAGWGGEVLYRPFRKRWGLGLNAYHALERYPNGCDGHLGLTGHAALTSHATFFYEMADQDVTFELKAGRYLGGDYGTSLSLVKNFESGARFESFVTATDLSDVDLFGGTTHVNAGMRFIQPLQLFENRLGRFEVETRLEPFGRYAGQELDVPKTLYEVTEPLSYRHQALYWEH